MSDNNTNRHAIADVDLTTVINLETIASVDMTEILGDYDDPEAFPEWRWLFAKASYFHRGNGVDQGVWECVINLANDLGEIPPTLRPLVESARGRGAAYLLAHQG